MSQIVYFVRHGEVHNPEKILYGRQSGWNLSERGKLMAEKIAEWSKKLNVGAVFSSPLERAQQTAAPIAKAHNLNIQTNIDLIEADNIFEGKKFEVGSGVLMHPSTWKYLINPAKPSWGEPYVDLVNRMLRALWLARDNSFGKSAICVSHQLPIWILRRFIEGKSFIHDPRRRQCTLASVTAIELEDTGSISKINYLEPAKDLLPHK